MDHNATVAAPEPELKKESDGTDEVSNENLNLVREARVLLEERGEPTIDWSKKMTGCPCFSYLFQLILLATLNSAVFGYSIANMNTSTTYVSWEYGWCDYLGGSEMVADCPTHKLYSALISASLFAGAAIGAAIGGNIVSMGRRSLLMIANVVFIVGAITSACANSFSALFWSRIISGVAVGLTSIGAPTYLSEVCPPSVRGRYGVLHQVLICCGFVVAALLGLPFPLVSPMPNAEAIPAEVDLFPKIWWRVTVAMTILPSLFSLYLLGKVYVFETPLFLIQQGQYADAQMLFRRILNKDDVTQELNATIREAEMAEASKKAGMTLASSMKRPDYRKVVILGCIFSVFMQFGGINVYMSSSNALFLQAGLEGPMPVVMTIVMQLIFLISVFPSVPLIESAGRKPLLFWGCIAMGVSTLPATICYWAIGAESNVTMWLAIVGCFLFVASFAVTYGPVLWVYLFEMFPIEIKGTAAGVATAFNWASAVITVFVAGNLDNNINYTIFTAMNFLGGIVVWAFLLETKGRIIGDSPYVKKQ